MFIAVYPYKNDKDKSRFLILDIKDCTVESVPVSFLTEDMRYNLNIKNLAVNMNGDLLLYTYNMFEYIPKKPVSGMYYYRNILGIPDFSDIQVVHEFDRLKVNGVIVCEGVYDILYIFKFKTLVVFRCIMSVGNKFNPFTVIVDNEGYVETYKGVEIEHVKNHKAEVIQMETIMWDV